GGTHPTVEQVEIQTGAGNDLVQVGVDDAYKSPTSVNGAPNQSLRFHVVGQSPAYADRLIVQDAGAGDLVVLHQGADGVSGRVSVAPGAVTLAGAALGGVGLADVVYTGIGRIDVTPVNNITGATGPDGLGRLITFHADPFEYNDTRLVPTPIERVAENVTSPNIDPGAVTTPFQVGGDEDWYRFVPQATNTFQIRILFQKIVLLANGRPGLPGQGDLSL